jgi:hypothetical protein
MSDASLLHCNVCDQPEYVCECVGHQCCDCGEPFSQEASLPVGICVSSATASTKPK